MAEPSEKDFLLGKKKKSNFARICKVPLIIASSGVVIALILFAIVRRSNDVAYLLDDSGGVENRSAPLHKCNESESTVVDLVYEDKIEMLFKFHKRQTKFEASSVTIADGFIYAICDNSWSVSKFDPSPLKRYSASNTMIGNPDRFPNEDSGFEALFESGGRFYALRESIQVGDSYHSVVMELELGTKDYKIVSQCRTEFEFDGTSKGFEGAVGFRDADGILYIVALCEGNRCSESSKKNKAGHGRAVLMRKKVLGSFSLHDDPDAGCVWETFRTVKLPKSAAFRDYSDWDITDDGRVVISSQEDSMLWIGRAVGVGNGTIDPDEFGFDSDVGDVYSFPKTERCETVYCNIEGIHFISEKRLVAVSDKAKGKQDSSCSRKDQSLHVFALP